MARGAEAKLRRRNRRKAGDDGVIDMFGTEGGDENGNDDGDDGQGYDDFPGPPSRSGFPKKKVDDDDEDNDDGEVDNLPKRNKKGKSYSNAAGTASALPKGASGGGLGGIKTTPLILLIMMVGTTLLPALIFAGDYASSLLAKNNVMGAIGFRLGIGAVPKQRVLSFYEKHAPEKIADVPSILSKHYGQYPTLIKKLERKYQDYGYFMGWEQDEAPLRLAREHVQAAYDVWIQQYWNRHAPQFLKTAFRNIRYNLTFLYKRGYKLWKRRLWPLLEPIFGVPDGADAQKRKDAASARQRKQKSSSSGSSGSRRRNTDFRDDEEE